MLDTKAALEALAVLDGPWQSCAANAADHLARNWESKLLNKVDQRFPLVELMRGLVFSESFANEFASSSTMNTPMFKLGEEPIGNPFLWLENYAIDSKPSAAKSAWILQMIAHQR